MALRRGRDVSDSWSALKLFVRITTKIMPVLAAVLLAGCAVGPDFKRPEAPAAKSYTTVPLQEQPATAEVASGAAQHFDVAGDVPADWWTLFQSPPINSLIERAFKANPDIVAAQAALRQAEEYANAQRGYFYPSVVASYSPSRNKVAGNAAGASAPGIQNNGQVIAPAYANAPVYYNFHTAQLSIGYMLDVFGANRRQAESMQAQAEAQRYQMEAAYLTLASNIVAAALQEAALRAQIAATEKIVAAGNENLAIMQKQLQLGDISALDLAGQQAALAQSEQQLIPLRRQLEQTRDLIRALAGNTPDADVPETFELASLHLPEELPLSLPSKLVEQRPDVRSAEAQLHAASAQYGVAIANRLPQFSVSAAVGGMAAAPNWMFKAGGDFFNLAVNVSETLFDGGTLRAKSRAAQQALVQAGAQYRSVVIAALQNVADTLHAIQSDAEALQAAVKSEQALLQVRDLTRKQYDTGYVSYQQLLLAEQNYQQAVVTLIQAQTNRLGDTAALYQALGGGWWNRDKVAQKEGSKQQ